MQLHKELETLFSKRLCVWNSYLSVCNKERKNDYEDYCRNLLLQDKRGCTIDNVGRNFNDCCEEELRDFVENSPFCPILVKEEFKESQECTEVNQDEDLFVFGDSLYIEPDENLEMAQRNDHIHLYELAIDEDKLEDRYENSDPN